MGCLDEGPLRRSRFLSNRFRSRSLSTGSRCNEVSIFVKAAITPSGAGRDESLEDGTVFGVETPGFQRDMMASAISAFFPGEDQRAALGKGAGCFGSRYNQSPLNIGPPPNGAPVRHRISRSGSEGLILSIRTHQINCRFR